MGKKVFHVHMAEQRRSEGKENLGPPPLEIFERVN